MQYLAITELNWRRKCQPTPVFLPGESQGQRSLVGCRLWGPTESDMTEVTQQHCSQRTYFVFFFNLLRFILRLRLITCGLCCRMFHMHLRKLAFSCCWVDSSINVTQIQLVYSFVYFLYFLTELLCSCLLLEVVY